MSGRSYVLALAAVALLAALLSAGLYHPAPPSGQPRADMRARQRWDELTAAEQRGLVQLYRTVASRPDAGDMFERARRFAALPPSGQARLRELHDVLGAVLARLPADRRRALLLLHERARAEELYRLLAAEQPQVLARLRGPAAPAP